MPVKSILIRYRIHWLIGMILLGPSTIMQANAADEIRTWAILTGQDTDLQNLSTVVLAKLSAIDGIELIERDRVDAVTGELSLSSALSADSAVRRLELGRLIGADGMVILARSNNNPEHLELIIVDSRTGARLHRDQMSLSAPIAGADQIVEAVRDVRKKYPLGVDRIVAILPFVSKSLIPDAQVQGRAFAGLLGDAATQIPGVASLEVTEARAIRREIQLSGEKLVNLPIPILVEGSYRLEGTPKQTQRSCQMTLKASDGSGYIRELNEDFDSIEKMSIWLSQSAWPKILVGIKHLWANDINVVVTRLCKQAEQFELLGERTLATDNYHAALLLKPGDATSVIGLCTLYMKRIHGTDRPRWSKLPDETVAQRWRSIPEMFVDGMELIEDSFHRNQLSPQDTYLVTEKFLDRFESFSNSLPHDPPSWNHNDIDDPELLKILDIGLQNATQAAWHYRKELLPAIFATNPKSWDETDLPSKAYSREFMLEDIFARLFLQSNYFRKPNDNKDWWKPYPKDLLNHYRDIAMQYRTETRYVATPLVDAICAVTSHPERYPEIDDAYLDKLFDDLESTEGYTLPLYAALGRVLLERFRGDPEERIDAADAKSRLIEIEQAFGSRFTSIPQSVKQLQSRMQPDKSNPIDPEYPIVSNLPPSPDYPYGLPDPARVRLERLHFDVLLTDGRRIPFTCSAWTDQHGFIHGKNAPEEIVPTAGRFDLVWAKDYALLHRTPGLFEQLDVPADAGVAGAGWDGQRVWVITKQAGILLFDERGRMLDRIDAEDGLPPASDSATLQVTGDGQAIVAGSFRSPLRSWVAGVTYRDGKANVTILLESKERKQRNSTFVNDLTVPYSIGGSYLTQDPARDGHEVVIIERVHMSSAGKITQNRDWAFLAVDPRTYALEMYWRADGMAARGDSHYFRPTFMPDGGWMICRDFVLFSQHPAGFQPSGRSPVHTIHQRDVGGYFSRMIAYDGYVYLPDKWWARVDLQNLQYESLGHPLIAEPYSRTYRHWLNMGVSAHFGLLTWYEGARIHRATILPDNNKAVDPLVRQIRVISDETGDPILGAQVQLGRGADTHSGLSDTDGYVEVDALNSSTLVMVSAQGHITGTAWLHAGRHRDATDQILTIRLRDAALIGGQLLNGDGQPLPQHQVSVIDTRPSQNPFGEELRRFAVTDHEGHWQLNIPISYYDQRQIALSCLAPGGHSIQVTQLDSQQLEDLLARNFIWRLGSKSGPKPVNERASAERLQLQNPSYHIHIVDEQLRPIPGASVLVERSRDDVDPVRLMADVEGLVGIHTNLYKPLMIAAADGYRSCVFSIWTPTRLRKPTVSTESQPRGTVNPNRIQVILKQGGPDVGRVVDQTNTPLPGVQVSLGLPSAGDSYFRNPKIAKLLRTVTDSDGVYKFEPGFDNTLDAQWDILNSGYEVESRSHDNDGMLVLTLAALRVTHIWGELIDGVTGDTIKDHLQASVYNNSSTRSGQSRNNQEHTATVNGGRYDLYIRGNGKWVDYSFQGDNYHRAHARIQINDQKEIQKDLILSPIRQVRVRVLNANGHPVESAQVFVSDNFPSMNPVTHMPSMRAPNRYGNTNADGYITLDTLPDEHAIAAYTPYGYSRVVAYPDSKDVTICLADLCTIKGRWIASDQDLDGIVLQLGPGVIQNKQPDLITTIRVSPDQDGRFEIAGIIPGMYNLRRVKTRLTASGYTHYEHVNGPWARSLWFELTPGDTYEFELAPLGAELRGRITYPQDLAQAELTVDLHPKWSEKRPNPQSLRGMEKFKYHCTLTGRYAAALNNPVYKHPVSSDGQFVFDAIPPGDYELKVRRHQKAIHSQSILIPPPVKSQRIPPYDLGNLHITEKQVKQADRKKKKRSRNNREGLIDYLGIYGVGGSSALLVIAVLLTIRYRLSQRRRAE